jgi:predicted nucleic acid-binding protein
LSIQVLIELYATPTRKLKMSSLEAEGAPGDLVQWPIHRPTGDDVMAAIRVQRRYGISWWVALIVHSAQSMGCTVLWTEDLADGQRCGGVVARDPFHDGRSKRPN